MLLQKLSAESRLKYETQNKLYGREFFCNFTSYFENKIEINRFYLPVTINGIDRCLPQRDPWFNYRSGQISV